MCGSEIRATQAAIGFLTRLPVGGTFDADDVARGATWFPLVGAGVGAVGGAVVRRAGPAAGLAVTTVLTGALHLDALADSADALGVRDRSRALEVMRDSRIGSFGAAAIGIDLLVRAEALGRIDRPVAAWACAGALSRTVAVVLGAALPYARPAGGTGAVMARTSWARVAAACASAGLVGLAGGGGWTPVVAAAGVGGGSAWFWHRRIGGVTGDVLGASLALTESAVLLTWARR